MLNLNDIGVIMAIGTFNPRFPNADAAKHAETKADAARGLLAGVSAWILRAVVQYTALTPVPGLMAGVACAAAAYSATKLFPIMWDGCEEIKNECTDLTDRKITVTGSVKSGIISAIVGCTAYYITHNPVLALAGGIGALLSSAFYSAAPAWGSAGRAAADGGLPTGFMTQRRAPFGLDLGSGPATYTSIADVFNAAQAQGAGGNRDRMFFEILYALVAKDEELLTQLVRTPDHRMSAFHYPGVDLPRILMGLKQTIVAMLNNRGAGHGGRRNGGRDRASDPLADLLQRNARRRRGA
jgi:hypothetical protein